MPTDFEKFEPVNSKTPTPEQNGFVYPTQRGGDETVELAHIQTALARNLYYHPGDGAKDELSLVAGKLRDGLKTLELPTQMALGDRLFGQEGLLSRGEGPQRKDDATCAKELDDLLARVESQDKASAHDRVVTVAMLGDIGAMFTENTATTGLSGGRTPEQILQIKEAFAFNQKFADKVKVIAGSSVLGPDKKTDRTRSDDNVARTGIFGTGEEVDKTLLNAGDAAIKPSSWAVGMIKEASVMRTTEPWAGHISGSPPEILLAWESLLHKDQGIQPFVHAADQPGSLSEPEIAMRNSRSALAHGFFPATGYHSAMEVMESALLYSGQTTRQLNEDNAGKKVAAPTLEIDGQSRDTSRVFGRGAATTLIGDLCNSQTHSAHRGRVQQLPDIRSTDALRQATQENHRSRQTR